MIISRRKLLETKSASKSSAAPGAELARQSAPVRRGAGNREEPPSLASDFGAMRIGESMIARMRIVRGKPPCGTRVCKPRVIRSLYRRLSPGPKGGRFCRRQKR
jgi:hypothetical protein